MYTRVSKVGYVQRLDTPAIHLQLQHGNHRYGGVSDTASKTSPDWDAKTLTMTLLNPVSMEITNDDTKEIVSNSLRSG
jgi:hypothetical protein